MSQDRKPSRQAKSTKTQVKQNRFQYSATYLAICGAMLALVGQDVLAGSSTVVGRTDGYNWDGTSVNIDNDGAAQANADHKSDYRSILVWASNPNPMFFKGGSDTADYDLSTARYAYMPADQSTWSDSFYGPSIFHAIATFEVAVNGPKPMQAQLDPVRLDAYQWESGYIYLEPQDRGNLLFNYGFGFVPGIINMVNTSCTAGADTNTCAGTNQNAGGDLSLTSSAGSVNGLINVGGKVSYSSAVSDAMSTSLPWRSAGAAISLTSQGGSGSARFVGSSNESLPGGPGGAVTLDLTDFKIQVGPKGALSARATAPFAVLSAVSRGGIGIDKSTLLSGSNMPSGPQNVNDKGTNGAGGSVQVTLDKVKIYGSPQTFFQNTTHTSSFVIGVVAASVGGATQWYRGVTSGDEKADANRPGTGGEVTVRLISTSIGLPANNSIGVIATSTGDETLFQPDPLKVLLTDVDSQPPQQVSVSIDSASSILVGQKGFDQTKASAGDMNIAVLANASSNWGRELFTGATLSNLISGPVGGVSVQNDGTLTAYGPNAIGVLAQSIGGVSISSPGGDAVGDPESSDVTDSKGSYLPGADGNQVLFTHTGSITVQGDGATGALLQSIGGGGGAGGNSTGLFVAVGGKGGSGGDGGALIVTLSDSTITTSGDYARGVIGHTIGGGGGNGGHAKAYGALVGFAIGGSGGSGGSARIAKSSSLVKECFVLEGNRRESIATLNRMNVAHTNIIREHTGGAWFRIVCTPLPH